MGYTRDIIYIIFIYRVCVFIGKSNKEYIKTSLKHSLVKSKSI